MIWLPKIGRPRRQLLPRRRGTFRFTPKCCCDRCLGCFQQPTGDPEFDERIGCCCCAQCNWTEEMEVDLTGGSTWANGICDRCEDVAAVYILNRVTSPFPERTCLWTYTDLGFCGEYNLRITLGVGRYFLTGDDNQPKCQWSLVVDLEKTVSGVIGAGGFKSNSWVSGDPEEAGSFPPSGWPRTHANENCLMEAPFQLMMTISSDGAETPCDGLGGLSSLPGFVTARSIIP